MNNITAWTGLTINGILRKTEGNGELLSGVRSTLGSRMTERRRINAAYILTVLLYGSVILLTVIGTNKQNNYDKKCVSRWCCLPARSTLPFQLVHGVRDTGVKLGPVGVHSTRPPRRVPAEQPRPSTVSVNAVATAASPSIRATARRTAGHAPRTSRQVPY